MQITPSSARSAGCLVPSQTSWPSQRPQKKRLFHVPRTGRSHVHNLKKMSSGHAVTVPLLRPPIAPPHTAPPDWFPGIRAGRGVGGLTHHHAHPPTALATAGGPTNRLRTPHPLASKPSRHSSTSPCASYRVPDAAGCCLGRRARYCHVCLVWWLLFGCCLGFDCFFWSSVSSGGPIDDRNFTMDLPDEAWLKVRIVSLISNRRFRCPSLFNLSLSLRLNFPPRSCFPLRLSAPNQKPAV